MSRVVVHIDRLVMDGVDAPAAREIATALGEELARRVMQPGAAARLQGLSGERALAAVRVAVAPGLPSGTIGVMAAQALDENTP